MINTSQMIFVFGSNVGGIHGAGAARYAWRSRGAEFGVGIGLTGSCYAIPTKGVTRKPGSRYLHVGATLPLHSIRTQVDDFIEYARIHPELQFQVTRIGCGLAGLSDEDIAPMFSEAPENCYFDSVWQQIFDEQYFGKKFNYWGTF